LTDEEAALWVRLVWLTGNMTLLSEIMPELRGPRLELLQRVFPVNAEPARVVDWYVQPELHVLAAPGSNGAGPSGASAADALLVDPAEAAAAAAAAAAAEFGIRLTGVQADFDVNAWRDYYANRFTATFSDEDTLVSHVQGAYNGNGTWQQVAMDEYMTYGFEGQNEMIGVPPVPRDQEVKIPGVGAYVAADCKYSAIAIGWTEDIRGLVTVAGAQGTHLIYLNLDSSGDLDTGTANTGETLAVALGLTAANLDE
jgi:hypothetical protein